MPSSACGSGVSPCASSTAVCPVCRHRMSPALDRRALRVARAHEIVVPHRAPGIAVGAPQVHEHAAALHTRFRHALDAQRPGAGERRLPGRLRRGHVGADVHAAAIAVVVAHLRHAVAVRVEHRPDVRERVPVRGELAVQQHRIVAEHVGMVGVGVQVVLHAAVAHHRLQARRAPLQVVVIAAGTVERQRQAERAARAHFGRRLPDLLRRDQIEAAALVVGAEVAPVGARRTLPPSHRCIHSRFPRSRMRRLKHASRSLAIARIDAR